MRTAIFALMFLVAQVALAQVSISEIMYNPQGSDTGHEWVEIINQGSASVDLAQSKFIEGGSNHGLISLQGGTELLSGMYAIIADNAQTFLSDHIGFSGIILDSSFSLNNTTGETIAFKTPDGTIDTVSYTKEMGASEDGDSLQKVAGVLSGAIPTPGVLNAGAEVPAIPEAPASSSTTSALSNNSSFPVEPQIIADAGASTRTTIAGAYITFTGRVFGLKKEPIENARMVWSFGDGGTAEGAGVTHIYYYPGDYIAVLDAASGYYSASDRVTVHVATPLLALRTGGDSTRSFVAIENRGGDEIDLSLWQIESASKVFIIPQNTILAARKTLALASEVTGLVTPEESVVSLHFPNGTRVDAQNNIETATPVQVSIKESVPTKESLVVATPYVSVPRSSPQEASVINAFVDDVPTPSKKDSNGMWPWYSGAAFLGALALFGIRTSRMKDAKQSNELNADDFEIVEDEDKKEDIF